MSRPKGSKNKILKLPVESFSYTTEQRIELVASLIVDRIIEDSRNGRRLLEIAGANDAA